MSLDFRPDVHGKSTLPILEKLIVTQLLIERSKPVNANRLFPFAPHVSITAACCATSAGSLAQITPRRDFNLLSLFQSTVGVAELRRGAIRPDGFIGYAAEHRSASSSRSQTTIWFQLATVEDARRDSSPSSDRK
jgi:hypothetical protein